MKKRTLTAETPQFLSGWKEISTFLGKGVRTVQRYERDLGLPVRRPAGKDRGSVVAVKAELDGWVKASPIREVFRLRNVEQLKAQAQAQAQAHSFKMRLSELVALRDQMTMLRAEVKESILRLRDTIQGVQQDIVRGQLEQRQSKYPSQIYSDDEYELLDREAAMRASIKYPKAS